MVSPARNASRSPSCSGKLADARMDPEDLWIADTGGLGYEGGGLVFGAGLAIFAAAYYWTDISKVALFWGAFILTRPLGATVADFLDKPVSHGGLNLSRPLASAVIAIFIVGCMLLVPQRPGTHPGGTQNA